MYCIRYDIQRGGVFVVGQFMLKYMKNLILKQV